MNLVWWETKLTEIKTQIEKAKSALKKIFDIDSSRHPTELVYDPETGSKVLRIRAAHFVHCSLLDFTPKFARAGILADVGFKTLTRGKVEEFDSEPPVAEKEVLELVDGTKITIFGRPDGLLRIEEDVVIPVELKNSSNPQTIKSGRLQAALYAWLYDAPFAILIHHPDLRMDVIEPLTDEQIKKRAAVLASAILSNNEKVICPEIVPRVIAADITW